MVAPRQRLVLVVCVLAALFLLPIAALAVDYVQEIKNKTSSITANDLTIYFTADDDFVLIDAAVTDPVGDPKGEKPAKPDRKLATKSLEFPKGRLPTDVKPGGALKLSFSGPKGTRVDMARSYWTENGKQIVDALASLGQPADIFFAGGTAFAELANPSAFTLVYSDIHLYRDNDLSRYGTPFSAYDITGTSVGGLPSMLTLAPGASTRLDFGSVSDLGYELITMNVALSTDPESRFFLASASAIPEGQTWVLMSLGLLVVSCFSLRRPPLVLPPR